MRPRKWTKEDFTSAVESSTSVAQVLTALKLNPTGGNYKTVNRYVREYELSTDHWSGQSHLKGKTHNWGKRRPLTEICVQNSDYLSSSHLKARLFKEGLLVNVCTSCGQEPQWHGKPLTLVLDHINGNNIDNRLENLRILCPHCHSQTTTFAGRNRRS